MWPAAAVATAARKYDSERREGGGRRENLSSEQGESAEIESRD